MIQTNVAVDENDDFYYMKAFFRLDNISKCLNSGSCLIVACWLHAIRKRGMSNPNPFFMVFIINFNVLKVYDKETERFVKRIVKIEIYIIF